MVGKARSSNFTLQEKLDFIEILKPYVKVLEEHTNRHSVIIEKNKCWDTIAKKYNNTGGSRPHRTAIGLRMLYKRLKEYAKQELIQQARTQHEQPGRLSEATRKLVRLIPQMSQTLLQKDNSDSRRVSAEEEEEEEEESALVSASPVLPLVCPSISVTVDSESDEDPKPASLTVCLEDSESIEGEDFADKCLSTPCASADIGTESVQFVSLQENAMPSSSQAGPSQRHDNYVQNLQFLEMFAKEHELIMENRRKVGLYIHDKREGLRRKQELEEELLRVKIEVEKLKEMQLRQMIPM
ncbi:fibrinogen silencer-binding protein-like [Protopterus annectens]|uniref:fibrinogen silencer-binding protein-like n=1 Tax=Protopterus annectens TaxID=7888 RepID=UPI001CFBD28B|nr:fibrinogen silencer-binding protein-like [Protopterus annectens]